MRPDLPLRMTRGLGKVAFILSAVYSANTIADYHAIEDDIGLGDLEALMNVEVVSASKFKQQLSDIPAAVSVITADDIRQMSARSVPEALRMVPGIQVSRSTGNNWAVSSRGFHGSFSNKLLVMIDGRSIYSPLFAGVFWDAVDINMNDIERIEVIRGPGSTVWGANAVNGVINIITKAPVDMSGTDVYTEAGTDGFIHGGIRRASQLGDQHYGKAWLTYKKYQNQEFPAGIESLDKWHSFTTGIGLQKVSGDNEYSINTHWSHQKVYDPILSPIENQNETNKLNNDSGSLALTYQKQIKANVGLTLTAYYSAADRKSEGFDIFEDLYNLELDSKIEQQKHRWTWGLSFREHQFKLKGKEAFSSQEEELRSRIFSGYLQNDWFISESSTLTTGLKYENHHREDFSNGQLLPSIRFLQTLSEHTSLWLAVSRSARVPSISENFLSIPLSITPALSAENPSPWPVETQVVFNPDFEEETVWTYELGVRGQLSPFMGYDLALYYSDFNNLRTTQLGSPICLSNQLAPPACAFPDTIIQPITFENGTKAETSGLEFSWWWTIHKDHQLQLGYHYLDIDETTTAGEITESSLSFSPLFQAFVVYDWNISPQWSNRVFFRYVDQYRDGLLDQYESLDLVFNYDVDSQFNVSFGARDLFHDKEAESVIETAKDTVGAIEVQTSYFLSLSYSL